MTTTAGHARPVFEPRGHHAPGMVAVPIPPRLRWWRQLRREQLCRKLLGHCWHPDQMTTWECCGCAALRDGPQPVDRCRLCTSPSRQGEAAGAVALVRGVEEGSASLQQELSPMELYTRYGAIPTGRTAEILMEAERGWQRRQETERARDADGIPLKLKSNHQCRLCGRWLEGEWANAADQGERDRIQAEMDHGRCEPGRCR